MAKSLPGPGLGSELGLVFATMNRLTRCPLFVGFSIKPQWTEQNIFAFALIMSWVKYMWYRYLFYRQRKVCNAAHQVPPELRDITDQETFSKARLYQLDKMDFGFYRGIWDLLTTTVILWSGGICFLWKFCERVAVRFGAPNNELVNTCLFLFVGSLMSTLFGLPWSTYYTFVIEQRHGFNKQTPTFFAKDTVKRFILGQVIMLPFTCGIVQIVKMGGEYFFVYLWLFTLAVATFISFIYMEFIAPLFDKFTPLPEGELKTEIEKLAGSVGFPLKEILIVEGSKRSSHSNAYFSGVFKKKIVLFDTLFEKDRPAENESSTVTRGNDTAQDKALVIKKPHNRVGCNDDEILGILAHELGHWKHAHVTKMFVIRQIYHFCCFMALSKLFKDDKVYKAFGFYDSKPVCIGFNLILGLILSPCNTLVSALVTALCRHFEFQADFFACRLHHSSSLRGGLIKLNRDNLGFPVNDWLYSAWRNSHPPVLERIQSLDKTD
ncbi:CAAX prenyl protease 1 homolog [Amblyomma americanum]